MDKKTELKALHKYDAEIKQLELQNKLIEKDIDNRSNFIEKYKGAATFLLALVGVGTLLLNLSIESRKYLGERSESVSESLQMLSSENPIERASSVEKLLPIISEKAGDNVYVKSLVMAYSTESSRLVRNIILTSLFDVSEQAVIEFGFAKKAMLERVVLESEQWGGEFKRHHSKRIEDNDPAILKSFDEVRDAFESFRNAQRSYIHIADGLRQLECHNKHSFIQAVQKIIGKHPCPIDLSGSFFRSFSFAELDVDLRNAIFNDASLFAVDFFESELTGAVFYDSEIIFTKFNRSILTDAEFINVDFAFPEPGSFISDQEVKDCRDMRGTKFTHADLDGAVFRNLSLDGINLSESLIQLNQFVNVKWGGAFVSTELSKELNPKHINPTKANTETKCDELLYKDE